MSFGYRFNRFMIIRDQFISLIIRFLSQGNYSVNVIFVCQFLLLPIYNFHTVCAL